MSAIATPHPEFFSLDGPDRLADRRGTLGRTAAAERFAERTRRPGLVCVTLPAEVATVAALRTAARLLGPVVDAVLLDEPAGGAGLALTHRAAVLRAEGAEVIVVLGRRDRNRVALEGELAALAEIDVAAVLIAAGHGPAGDAAAGDPSGGVCDLSAAQLAALARRAGHTVAVPEPFSATEDLAPEPDLRVLGAGEPRPPAARPHPAPPMLAVLPVDLADAAHGPAAIRAVVAASRAATRRPGVVGVLLEGRRGGRTDAAVSATIARIAGAVREAQA
ncbi:hypothetical protein [Microbacterium sp. cx-59]|uniref:hypothetical protein n=1 Tax=Microbacterium sp. cx-59 TaxID=2891207 RepID=UPI001E61B875|nr:hypothetical protein [Microbacterium sp. cx-59]MCC4907928.1 hypothetical protein [Microbacterium sp. cx-59]